MFTVAALYKFTPLENPASIVADLSAIAEAAKTTGTLLIAPEGINGTIAGSRECIDAVLGGHVRWRLNRRKKGGYYERSRHLFLPLYFPALAERSAGRLDNSRALNHEHSAVARQLEPALSAGEVELTDATLQRAAVAAMRENWLKHLALIPPLMLRGTGLQAPLLLGVLLAVVWRRSRPLAVFAAPVLVSIGFHAALTHFIPRYGLPLLAVTAVATAWALGELVRAVGRRSRHGRRR